jgi:hypothetical protein
MGSTRFFNYVDEFLRDQQFTSFGILAVSESKLRLGSARLKEWEEVLTGEPEYERRKKPATALECLRTYLANSDWLMVTEYRADHTRFHIAMQESYIFDGSDPKEWRDISGGWRFKRPIDHEGMCRLFTHLVVRQGLTFSICFGGRIENRTAEDFW